MWTTFFLVICLVYSSAAPNNAGVRNDPSFSIQQTAEKIMYDGYNVETHYVTTTDGYILQVHRIPYRRYENASNNARRPVVFLMHGLMAASNSFIAIGAEHSVAYNLADAGFDVWMGNARGNANSRNHVTLDPDHDQEKFEFFDFSFEEIGMYDVAAMIDYVLDRTDRTQLHYIGHSQGGTVFLVLSSMRPEYNDKFASVHLLAGVGYMQYFPNTQLIGMAALSDIIYNLALSIGFVELFPPSSTEIDDENNRVADYCVGDLNYKYMCDVTGVRHILRDDNPATGILDDLEELEVAGGALKQIAHYGQNIRDQAFRRWSYGIFQNLGVYGAMNPPAYNLSLITANVTMHYTVNDNLLDERDVLAMAEDMPNTIVRKVARESFLHEDFVVALDAKELVTDYIIGAIQAVSPSESDNLDTVEISEIIDGAIGGEAEADGDSASGVEEVLAPTEMPSSSSGLVLSSILNVYLIIYSLNYFF